MVSSQQRLAESIAESVLRRERVCVCGESGSGRTTVLQAVSALIESRSGNTVARLEAQSLSRLAWSALMHSSGDTARVRDLTDAGHVLLIDDAECRLRIHNDAALAVVGDYIADVTVDLAAWSTDEIEQTFPQLTAHLQGCVGMRRCPRFLTLADSCLRLELPTRYPLRRCSLEHLVGRLVDYVERESPLSIDFLFLACVLGNLSIRGEWFYGWRGLSRVDCTSATQQLNALGLIDQRADGSWTAPAVVRRVVRQQMSIPFRRSVSKGLAEQLLVVAEGDLNAVCRISQHCGPRL